VIPKVGTVHQNEERYYMTNKRKVRIHILTGFFTLIFMVLAILIPDASVKAISNNASIQYKVHVQTYGDEKEYHKDGEMSGTSGQSKRLESISIKLDGISGDVEYRTHVQNKGWISWTKNGEWNGTKGSSKRLEAIQIRLTGEAAERYDIYYRVHAQTFGWLGWAKNGEMAGTAAMSKRLEGIQIVLVKKGDTPPNKVSGITSWVQCSSVYKEEVPIKSAWNIRGVAEPLLENGKAAVNYTGHIQSYGWNGTVSDNSIVGTTLQNPKRLEAIKVRVVNVKGGVYYEVKAGDKWYEAADGVFAGTTGKSIPLQYVSIRLTGEAATKYDIIYRVHDMNGTWYDGANGDTVGAGHLDAIQIRLAEKKVETPTTEEPTTEEPTTEAPTTECTHDWEDITEPKTKQVTRTGKKLLVMYGEYVENGKIPDETYYEIIDHKIVTIPYSEQDVRTEYKYKRHWCCDCGFDITAYRDEFEPDKTISEVRSAHQDWHYAVDEGFGYGDRSVNEYIHYDDSGCTLPHDELGYDGMGWKPFTETVDVPYEEVVGRRCKICGVEELN